MSHFVRSVLGAQLALDESIAFRPPTLTVTKIGEVSGKLCEGIGDLEMDVGRLTS